MIAITKMSL